VINNFILFFYRSQVFSPQNKYVEVK